MAIGLAAQAAFGPILKPLGDRAGAGARAVVRGETHVLQDTADLLRKMEPTPQYIQQSVYLRLPRLAGDYWV